MKQRFLILSSLILLILISSVSAIDVQLQYPENGASLDSYQTIFRCVTSIENADTITLKLKPQGDMWYNIQTKNVVEFVPIEFDYTFLASGNYIWNCMAKNSTGGEFEQDTDFSLQVDIQNPPTFSGSIPNQEWNSNEIKTNAFSLNSFFTDTDSTLTYNYTIDSQNISITIASDTKVTFIQDDSWVGTGHITFYGCDESNCANSNTVTLTVNQVSSPSNTAPTISGVPDQTKEVGDTWTLNLDEYIDDDEDSDSELIIDVTGEDTSIFTVSIDESNNELDFEAQDEGTDSFTIIVEDTDGATDSDTITITIEEEGTTDDEFNDDEPGVDITAASPATSRIIIIRPGEEKKFEITTNTYDITWYVDNSKQDETSRTFTYKPDEEGTHIIKVIAGTDTDIDMKTWDIEVKESETLTTLESNICGNNKKEQDETCLSCPEDAQCEDGEYCDEGECKKKTFNKITGFATKSKNFILDKWYYPTLVFAIILLIIIGIQVIKVNKKSKKPDDPLAQFSDKLTLKQRIQSKLREWDRKRTLKKQNKANFKRLKEAKKEHIRATAPNIDSVVTFIQQRTSEGNKKREVIKALKRNGWSRKHIKLAFKKLKNDSRNPT